MIDHFAYGAIDLRLIGNITTERQYARAMRYQICLRAR
jgi:hypothetical protein